MSVNLLRVRFQETWGEREGGYLPDAYLDDEVEGIIRGVALDWFPEGCSVTQDEDSPGTWQVDETGPQQRRVFLFVEPVG